MRSRVTYASAAGPWIRELRSITCANARADTLGRPLSVRAAALDVLKNRFGNLFRRARIFSLLQMAFLQANVPAPPPGALSVPGGSLPAGPLLRRG
ncbi:hypothetical protein MAHJHV45_26410 [Mycobacterium avium subsp. hominissuis]